VVFLDIHAIQSVPPANINRDENGSPKTARYGGAERMRVSSQAWKRAARKELETAASGFQASRRSKRLPELLAERLTERVPALRERAPDIAAEVVSSVFGAKTTKKKKNDKERAATEYLLFLGIDQQERLVDLLAGAGDRLADADTKLSEVVKDLGLGTVVEQGHPPAVALFGRMIATEPKLNVDAACQVAHALSTHAVEAQFDYYTAVDDVDSDADETGAGMIGSIEFNAATMYRYAAVDLRSLVANLGGDTTLAVDVAVGFARAFLLSMPTGKQATFANNTRPDAVLLSVRDDQPVSLVGAFEAPIRAVDTLDGGGTGYTVRSTAALLGYHAAQDDLYGTVPRTHVFSCSSSLLDDLREMTETVPAPVPIPAALDRVRKELAEAVGA
jgi:CRISPR system Cascade subunit CasC